MSFPKKNKIPKILFLALLFWATCAITYTYCIEIVDFEIFVKYFIYLLLFLILLICVLLFFSIKNNLTYLFIVISILLGITVSLNGAKILNNQITSCNDIAKQELIIKAIEDQKNSNSSNSCVVEVQNNKKLKIKLYLEQDFDEVHNGDTFIAKLETYSAYDTQKDNFWQNGICANAKATSIKKIENTSPLWFIYKYRNNLIETIRKHDDNSQAKQLLNAIVCGCRIDINLGDLYDSFKISGLAHMVAVSGAHLSLVSAVLLIILKKLKIKRNSIIIIQSLFILSYLICAGLPISAIRAAFMAYIAIYSFFCKRRPAPLNAIGLCIFILVGINPQTSTSTSFILSVGSTIGIILFSILFQYLIKSTTRLCPELISAPLSLTFSAGLCSWPISIALFSQFSIIAPIANIICTPLFTFVCAAGLLLTVSATIFSVFAPFIADLIMSINYFTTNIMCSVVKLLAKIPYASIPASINIVIAILISILLCWLIYVFWDKFNIESSRIQKNTKLTTLISSAVVLIIVIIIIFPKSSQTELIMFDVGQGDAIYLSSKGKNILIDTGNQDSKLKKCLAKNGINHLDGLLITHPDDDHCGSIDVIEQVVDVTKVYIAKDLKNCNDNNCTKLMEQIKKIVNDQSIIGLSVSDRISFGEIELEVVWPDEYKNNGGNADSLCMIANVDVNNDEQIDSRVLLCGDAEKEEIDSMYKKNRLSNIDIFKCGHHGSKNSIEDKTLKKIFPKITLISVGERNRYGHPAKNTISSIENCGSKIYRTDKQGCITVKFLGPILDISTEK